MKLKCPRCNEEMDCPACPQSPFVVNWEEEPGCPWCVDVGGPVDEEMEALMKMKMGELKERRVIFKQKLPFFCDCYNKDDDL